MGLVLDDVLQNVRIRAVQSTKIDRGTHDIDVTSLEGVNASPGVYRVFILDRCLRSSIQLVGAHFISAKIVKVKDVSLPRLSRHNTHTFDVRACKSVGREQLQWRCTKIFIGTIELFLFPRHEEVHDRQAPVIVDFHIDSCFLKRGRWLTTRDWSSMKLGGIAVSCGKVHASFAICRKTTARHPDSSTGGGVGLLTSFSGELLDHRASTLIPAHDPSCEVVLDTV